MTRVTVSEQRQFVSDLSRTPFEAHWLMNLDYLGISPPIDGQVCCVDGCTLKAFNYMCWGQTGLEFAPTCLYHDGADVNTISGTRWASRNVLFARPYLNTAIVTEEL